MPNTFQHRTNLESELAAGVRRYANAEEQELYRLKERLSRTPEERFKFLTMLMQLQRVVQSNKQGFINDKEDVCVTAFVALWENLNQQGVRYIIVGDLATSVHGCMYFTGVIDLFIEDSLENRKNFRIAYHKYGQGNFHFIETAQFGHEIIDFPLHNGLRLTIATELKGVAASFDECFNLAPRMEIGGQITPVLHINHLLDNKRAVARLKDQLDVEELEKIKKLLDQNQTGS